MSPATTSRTSSPDFAMKTLLLCVLAPLVPVVAIAQAAPKDNPAATVKTAGANVAKLLQFARDWTAQKRPDAARTAWKRVIEIEPGNTEARAGLNHQLYDGKWFEGHTTLFDYKRAEDERMAKQGLARLRDGWVPLADAPFLRLSWTRDEQGAWQHPLAKVRRQRDREALAKGCQLQDLEWVDPADFTKWQQGLWKCGDQWLDTAAANTWHADAARPWYVASEHFVISSTVERERVEWCKWYADQTWPELVRLFGITPGSRPSAIDLLGEKGDKPEFVVWRSLAQYNQFANSGSEVEGFSSLHYAFFADALADDTVKPPAWAALGTGFWDNSTPVLDAFGQHSIRHAAALSFVEAIDPSWKALGDAAMGAQAKSTAAFWAEKRIPRWLRYGAASYVERYFLDSKVGDGGNARWSRDWALQQLRKAGGLRDPAKVFEFKLTLTDVPGSTQLIHEAGLVTAFMLDGGDSRVQKTHHAFRDALAGSGSTAAAVAELQKALLAAKPALLAFAAK